MDIRNIKRLKEVYDEIREFVRHYGNFPSYRTIMEITSLTSTSMVAYYLSNLEKIGAMEIFEVGDATYRKITGMEVVFPEYSKVIREEWMNLVLTKNELTAGAEREEG